MPGLTVIKPGQVKSSRGLFIAAHWDGALPPGPGEFKVPPEGTEVHHHTTKGQTNGT